MGLISKETKVKWNSCNKKYYVNKGYLFTKMGDEFIVSINDLSNGSHSLIEVKCDKCDRIINKIWRDYTTHIKKDGTYHCRKCSIELYTKIVGTKTRLENSTSFEKWCIDNNRQDVLKRWSDKNGFKPNEVSYAGKKCWFECPNNEHPPELKIISNFTSGVEGSIYCKACGSSAQWGIKKLGKDFLEKYWSNKNKQNPWALSNKSIKEVYWKCPKGKHSDYKRVVRVSVRYDCRCPKCMKERLESLLQEKVRLYLESLNGNKYTILHEQNCTITPKNPKTKFNLLFDNEIKEFKLIIEVHGVQHYKLSIFSKMSANKNDTTPQQEFEYQQWKDKYKKDYALSQGYFYLEIPYWTDDEDETWRQLIDEKIEEIKTNK